MITASWCFEYFDRLHYRDNTALTVAMSTTEVWAMIGQMLKIGPMVLKLSPSRIAVYVTKDEKHNPRVSRQISEATKKPQQTIKLKDQ